MLFRSPSSPFPVLFFSLTSPLFSPVFPTFLPPRFPLLPTPPFSFFLLSFHLFLSSCLSSVCPHHHHTHAKTETNSCAPRPPNSSLRKAPLFDSRSFPDPPLPRCREGVSKSGAQATAPACLLSPESPTSTPEDTPEPRAVGASSSSQFLEASPQTPASLGSPWKRLRGLPDTPAGHGGAVAGPLVGQPALCRGHPSGSFLLHPSMPPQHPPSQGALAPASRAPAHLCPASQFIPEEAM